MFTIVRATDKHLDSIKAIADSERDALGFVLRATLAEAIADGRVFVAVNESDNEQILGFVHFRHCADGHTTVYEIAVVPQFRGKGIGRALVNAVVDEAKALKQRSVKLKCPVDLPANGFYQRIGFVWVGRESGKRRQLNVWVLPLRSNLQDTNKRAWDDAQQWRFFCGLTAEATEVRKLVRTFYAGFGGFVPFNPFEQVIITPIAAQPSTLAMVARWRAGDASGLHCDLSVKPITTLMFDSGGFQVQTGRIDFPSLCSKLLALYAENPVADFYVLPDFPVFPADSDDDAEHKIALTLRAGEQFLHRLSFLWEKAKAVGVVHGRTVEQVISCAHRWFDLGVDYVAFGSFVASGRNRSTNTVSSQVLTVLKALSDFCAERGASLHLFGIGLPSVLRTISHAGVHVASFDSVGWWKTAGFGQVFLHRSGVFHITASDADLIKFVQARDADGHSCPFCADLNALVKSRWLRVCHNLVAMCEAVNSLQSDSQLDYATQLSLPLLSVVHKGG